jgi:hypothetical protein
MTPLQQVAERQLLRSVTVGNGRDTDAMTPALYSVIFPCAAAGANLALPSVEDQIADFLDGKTHGESLLHALYDHILDEPVPERMRGLFR